MNNSYPCGGFTPINSSTAQPYHISYEATRDFAQKQALVVLFEAAAPAPGKHLYLSFGANSGTTYSGYAFTIEVTNCTATKYAPCWSDDSQSCFNQHACLASGVIFTATSAGNGAGVFIPNPGSSVITLVFKTDAAGQFYANQITLYSGDA